MSDRKIFEFPHCACFLAPTEWVSSAGFNISLPVYAQVQGKFLILKIFLQISKFLQISEFFKEW